MWLYAIPTTVFQFRKYYKSYELQWFPYFYFTTRRCFIVAFGTLFPLPVSGWGANINYKTDITVGGNGQEARNAVWQDPLMSFNAAFAVKTYADIDTLQTFFHVCKGREQSFLVKDLADFRIPRTTIGTGTGALTTFQLVKKYVHGVIGTYTRTITKPKQIEGAGGVRVWVNNVELADSAFSFSSTTGIITLSSAPANGHAVEASCDEYYVPCRFDIDELPIELLHYWVDSGSDGGIVQVPDIKLREVRGE